MVAITRLIFLASTVAAATIQLSPRDVITVENDITQKIGPQLNTLSNGLNGFPASGAVGAEKINQDAKTLIQTINTATGNVKATGSFGVVSGTTILAQIQHQVPQLLSSLIAISTQAEAWDAIKGPKLALDDLKAGKAAYSNYLDAIIASEPFLTKPGGIAIKTQILGAFDEAIKHFS